MDQTSRLRNKTLYDILGVVPGASSDEIRTQYKELARLYHPDSNFYSDIVDIDLSSEQVELFKVITSAYQTLVDPTKRANYDSKIRPLIDGNIPAWETRNDFWEASKPKKSTRRRAMTFGQTTKSVLRIQDEHAMPSSQSIMQKPDFKKSPSKLKSRRKGIVAVGFIIGFLLVLLILIQSIGISKVTTIKQEIQSSW